MGSSLKKWKELLATLERRGEMYVRPLNYQTLVAFLTGYNLAQIEQDDVSRLDEFREWLHTQLGRHCSMSWPTVVINEFAAGNEKNATAILFNLLNKFIAEKTRED